MYLVKLITLTREEEWVLLLQEICQCAPECLIRGCTCSLLWRRTLPEVGQQLGEGRGGAQVTEHSMLSTLYLIQICQPLLLWRSKSEHSGWWDVPLLLLGHYCPATAFAVNSVAFGSAPSPFKKEEKGQRWKKKVNDWDFLLEMRLTCFSSLLYNRACIKRKVRTAKRQSFYFFSLFSFFQVPD